MTAHETVWSVSDWLKDQTLPKHTQTEYMLLVDFLGHSGIFGSETRNLGAVSEAYAIKAAREALEHAGRVEVWTRTMSVSNWVRVEGLSGGVSGVSVNRSKVEADG